MKCEDCLAWVRNRVDGAKNGECHRVPPIAGDMSFGFSKWPVTFGWDWCLSFEPKPTVPAQAQTLRVVGE